MDIRQAGIGDAEAISALVHSLAVKYIAQELSVRGRGVLLDAMTAEAIRKYIRCGYRYHIAEEDGRVIGVVGVRDNKHLYHLFVAEDHQGRGIARQLWNVAMHACRSAGNSGEFSVNSSRNARRFYESLGFVAQSAAEERDGVIAIPMKLTAGGGLGPGGRRLRTERQSR